mmetsp:Transcript_31297/g.101097  ORF Transcript_31297/g.101097 Transcript_31297/m.101097 type:complete len:222 (+) Transcript_31297:179-844(+)
MTSHTTIVGHRHVSQWGKQRKRAGAGFHGHARAVKRDEFGSMAGVRPVRYVFATRFLAQEYHDDSDQHVEELRPRGDGQQAPFVRKVQPRDIGDAHADHVQRSTAGPERIHTVLIHAPRPHLQRNDTGEISWKPNRLVDAYEHMPQEAENVVHDKQDIQLHNDKVEQHVQREYVDEEPLPDCSTTKVAPRKYNPLRPKRRHAAPARGPGHLRVPKYAGQYA